MFAVEPLLGDWVYPAIALSPILGVAFGATVATIAHKTITRVAARWDAWCLAPNPTPIQRRRRPPNTEGTT